MIKNSNSGSYILLIIFLVLFSGSFCFAQGTEYKVGKYRVNVDVRTRTAQIITHAYVKCKKSKEVIKVSVYVPGYIPDKKELRIFQGVKKYNVMFFLKDCSANFDVRTFDFKPIASSYFENNQTGVPTNKYLVSLFIPKKNWPHPSPSNIYMNQEGYGIPIQESCEITTRDDFYLVKMLMMREFLEVKKIIVYVNTDQVIERGSAERWFRLIKKMEKGCPEAVVAANDLATILFRLLPKGIKSAVMPESLKRIRDLREIFNKLYSNK